MSANPLETTFLYTVYGNNMVCEPGVNMAESEEVDQVVNRWIVDYYLSYAFKLFQKSAAQAKELWGIADILSSE